jgi:hypothetical protein
MRCFIACVFDTDFRFETNELKKRYNCQIHLKSDEKNIFNGANLSQYFSQHNGHVILDRLELCQKRFILDNSLFFNGKALIAEDVLFYF